jgi:hypothetical protein
MGSFGIGFSGLILLATPYKQFSQALISTGIGSLIASNLAIENCTSITSRKLSKKDKEILLLQKDVKNFADILTAKHGELVEVLATKESLFKNYELLEKELLLKNFQLTTTLQELKNTQQINLASAIDTLNESLDEVTQQVNNLIPYIIKKFKLDIKDLDNQYKSELKDIQAQIKVLAGKNTLTNEEMISACLAIQHDMILKGSSIRAKLYKLAVDHLQKLVFNSISIVEHHEKIAEIKNYYQKNLQSIHQEFNQVADSCISAYKTDFTEVVKDGLSQSQELEKLQAEVINLQGKISELSKPLRFPGLTEPSRVGNAIIDFYLKLGYILDAIDWETSETGYKLLFHTSRNGSRFISCDLLNDGDNPHKIKEVSASLNTPKFEVSDRASYFRLGIQTRHKPKTSSDDIARLWVSAEKFPQLAKNWTRVRITGGLSG